MSKKVFAIIVTYNGIKWVEKCFNSLQNSSLPIAIIVIDNGSTDGTLEVIKNSFPNIQLIQSEKNLGFGIANNVGIKKAYDAGADYFFLLNQDVWLKDNAIEELIKMAELNDEYAIISPMHLNGTGTTFDYSFSKYIGPQKCKNIYSDIYLNQSKNKIYPVNFVNAAAWLVTRKCVEKVGGFSPSFFHYGEDDNYCERVLFHQLKIGVCPDTAIFHDREQVKSSNHFFSENILYKRKIIHQFSNPFSNRKVTSFYLSELKQFYVSLLLFRFIDVKKAFKNIMILKSIDFETLMINKQQSKKTGKNFL